MSESKTVINSPFTVTFFNSISSSVITVTAVTQTSRDGVVQPVVVNGPLGLASTLKFPPDVGFPIPPANPESGGLNLLTSKSSSSTESPKSEPPSTSASPSTSFSFSTPTSRQGDRTTSTSVLDRGPTGSPNQSASTRRQASSNSISPGAAAGIGIGCAIAGALIAAAILAFFFRRRTRRHEPSRSEVVPLNGFAPVEKTISTPDPSTPASLVDRNLPQPIGDQALGGELSHLRASIRDHVQNYYHTDNVLGSVDQAALGVIAAGNMPLIASSLASLLSNPATRLIAVRFCIAWVALSRIDHSCEPDRSFLPPEIAGCLVSIAGAREDPSTRMAFLSKWRTITASLLESKYGQATITSYDARNQNISEALQALDTVLSPYAAEKRNDRARTQGLEEVLKHGARFGFLLFSQPSTWELDWNAPSNAGRGALAISPSLMQIGDDHSRRLPRPRVVEEQELARGLDAYL
ncbi:MAG: hypothetical protein Q9219_005093 [cf. Caloplaca sp. 3 TL-2023]